MIISVKLLTAAGTATDDVMSFDDDADQITDATGMMINDNEVFTATGMPSDDDDEEFPSHDNDDLVRKYFSLFDIADELL